MSDLTTQAGTDAAEGRLTLAVLRDRINSETERLNTLLETLEQQIASNASRDHKIAMLETRVRQLIEAPQSAALSGGSALLDQLRQDIEDLKARPVGPMTGPQAEAARVHALARESKAHEADKMMYHSDPKHPQVAIVVHSDAEEKRARMDGYHPSLRQAAAQGLGEGAADEKAVLARMEELKRGALKVA